MNFDSLDHPYPSQRYTTYGTKGMVATSQPLAAQAGLEILKQGGNAVDAAIATAACLTVVEPTSNGIGGDAFALVWMKGKLHGLNASGPSPKSISIDALKNRGYKDIPAHGWIPVTVPGVPAAWGELSKKFGNLSLKETLAPAITHAEEGYALTPVLGSFWKKGYNIFKQKLNGEEFTHWFETFAPKGRAPEIGETWSSPDHARTLSEIAETDGESFYRGALADKMDKFSRKYDGFLRKADLEAFTPEWVEPISVNYRGYDVWEIPPNGQGIVALMGLNILEKFKLPEQLSTESIHNQIEALKLAYADGLKHVTEHGRMNHSEESLLSENYAATRRELISETALQPEAGEPSKGGTVYLAAADGEGNMVSYIQSNYMGFGSGLVVPGTGIALQNRGHNFSFDSEHVNALEGGKRTFHTIIPGFLTKNGKAVGPFGVMGGFMQPQGHIQVISNMIDYQRNPQAALDAPRWQWVKDKEVLVEPSFPTHVAQALARKGHHIKIALDSGSFGRGQIIVRNPETGVLAGGTESRTDGAIAVW